MQPTARHCNSRQRNEHINLSSIEAQLERANLKRRKLEQARSLTAAELRRRTRRRVARVGAFEHVARRARAQRQRRVPRETPGAATAVRLT
jgi:hypothetical protein